MQLNVEFLIIVKNAEEFCNNSDAFINFITVDNSIKKAEKKSTDDLPILYDSYLNIYIIYKLSVKENRANKERIFNLSLFIEDERNIDAFHSFTRKLKKILPKIHPENVQISTLHNDVGTYYSIKSYPFIHKIENNLRKLISKFMLINVGVEWHRKALNNDITQSLERRKTINNFSDYLQNVDFIDLSDVLFKPYRIGEISDIDDIIKNSTSNTDIEIDKLKSFLPKSNWERYFSKMLNINENSLKNKWEKLYLLRNDVAHNRFINKESYQQIVNIFNDINPKIEAAINHLSEIKLTSSDVKNIINSSILKDEITAPSMRLLAAAKFFNIGKETLVEHLNSNGFDTTDLKVSSKLSPDMITCLFKTFGIPNKTRSSLINILSESLLSMNTNL